ncbi:hypothetical protein ACD591_14710 [Rufibacter glacialis]|uniref:Uncharacterized protein n=1 Tax=Rufibacter glacialis TaxID=1259555 RepID=A0A5M8QT29_9BACT|nr:hypothetical protein [Rufibacter glacialis]KAA6437786.1 hypothetical protein FOE74_04615 [Rufibacter glacialis]GGK56238.1 hypothetical protein GCM10011405_00500 [Rufibacter glacialis]
MKIVRLNTLLTDLAPLMQEVQVITDGYLTDVKTIHCQRLEQVGTSPGHQPLLFYVNEQDHVIALHYARRLDLRKSICAIDYFPEHGPQELGKVSAKIQKALRK